MSMTIKPYDASVSEEKKKGSGTRAKINLIELGVRTIHEAKWAMFEFSELFGYWSFHEVPPKFPHIKLRHVNQRPSYSSEPYELLDSSSELSSPTKAISKIINMSLVLFR